VPAGCTIGVDLGGTKLLAGAVDEDLTVHHRALRQIAGLTREDLLTTVADAVLETAAAVNDAVDAVGFGIPCLIDRRTGVAVSSVHLPIRDLAFGQVIAEQLGGRWPVAVDNDANCAALVEARAGAGAGFDHVVVITVGTGIGGGLVLDGRLYRGAIGAGGELGHMVVDYDGPPCQGACPNRGCLESVASGSVLVRDAALAVGVRPDTPLGHALEEGEPLTGPLVTQMAIDGDPVACECLDRLGRRLGVGISNLVNVFNPDVVVIGGGVSEAGELLLGPARETMLQRALAPSRDHVQIVQAAFGPDAGMLGAAVLAREEAA